MSRSLIVDLPPVMLLIMRAMEMGKIEGKQKSICRTVQTSQFIFALTTSLATQRLSQIQYLTLFVDPFEGSTEMGTNQDALFYYTCPFQVHDDNS